MDEPNAYPCAKLLVDALGGHEAWRHAIARAVVLIFAEIWVLPPFAC